MSLVGRGGDDYFTIPFYLQSVPVHSANRVKTYTMACRRVLGSAPLQLMGSRAFVAYGRLTNYNYRYDKYTTNLVGRSFGRCLRNRLLSGSSIRLTTVQFACALMRALY
jgi:hypothetical protein